MSTTQSTPQPSRPGPMVRRRRRGAGGLLATSVACLAVLLAGACQGGEPATGTGGEGADAEPTSSTATDTDSAPAERIFTELAQHHPVLTEAPLTPEQEYATALAHHEADLSACAERTETGGTCPKPATLHGDLEKSVNVQLLLDASGSMAGRVAGETKLAIARRVMLRFVDSLPDGANVSLRVFGHVGSNSSADRARSCRGSELVLPWVSAGSDRIRSAVRSFGPRGWTPLARSLDASLGDFRGGGAENASNFVYVISDGIETCGGDPVAAARRLGNAGIGVDLNIVGFDVDSAAQRQLRRAARVAHGTYTDAGDAAELSEAFDAYDWAAWSRYYNCKYDQAYADYDAQYDVTWGNYNCVYDLMYREYNGVYREIYRRYDGLYDAAWTAYDEIDERVYGADLDPGLRDRVLALAQDRRDGVIAAGQQRRDFAVDQAQDRRDLIIAAAQDQREGLLAKAQNQRDRIIQLAQEQRDAHQ